MFTYRAGERSALNGNNLVCGPSVSGASSSYRHPFGRLFIIRHMAYEYTARSHRDLSPLISDAPLSGRARYRWKPSAKKLNAAVKTFEFTLAKRRLSESARNGNKKSELYP